MAFDPAGHVVLFGGQDVSGSLLGDTWAYEVRGNACADDGGCDTDHCVEGVCCETAAWGAGETCASLASPGRCAPR